MSCVAAVIVLGLIGGYGIPWLMPDRYTNDSGTLRNRWLTEAHLASLKTMPMSLAPGITRNIGPSKSFNMVVDCPASDGQQYETCNGDIFRKYCGVDWPLGEVTANLKGVVRDLMTVKTFTFNKCIEACSMYSSARPATKRLGVSWVATTAYLGNCLIKANIGMDQARMAD